MPGLPHGFPRLRTISTQSGHETPDAFAFPGRRTLRVVVAEDSVLLREGLSCLLAEAGFDVAATASDGEELLREVGRAHPDVVLTDMKMPPAHSDEGLLAAAEIRKLYPEVGVLVLSHYVDSDYALRLLEKYPERVRYLLKDRIYDVAVLSDAIRRVAEGECVIDPTIATRLKRGQAEGPFNDDWVPRRA